MSLSLSARQPTGDLVEFGFGGNLPFDGLALRGRGLFNPPKSPYSVTRRHLKQPFS
jgi:hypothetical protein